MKRRKFIKILGGGILVGAVAGSAGFLLTRTPKSALAPWQEAGRIHNDIRLWALSYAILAPNPHNRQPWLVDLATDNQIVIFRDKAKNLPETDPFARQLTIGMGCFCELLTIAASQKGFDVKFEFFPEGETGPVAIARFEAANVAANPLFDHILTRRSVKEPFEDRQPSQGILSEMSEFGDIIADEKILAKTRQITLNAWKIEYETPRTFKESVDLMRLGKAEINANPDGIDLGGPFLESIMVAGMLTRESLLDPGSESSKQGFALYNEMLSTTPSYIYLASQGNTRLDQIDAGRRWVSLNLKATSLGLSVHPVSQALQEFPEMSENYAAIHELLAKEGETIQMLGRLGYGPEVPASPRWSLENKVVPT